MFSNMRFIGEREGGAQLKFLIQFLIIVSLLKETCGLLSSSSILARTRSTSRTRTRTNPPRLYICMKAAASFQEEESRRAFLQKRAAPFLTIIAGFGFDAKTAAAEASNQQQPQEDGNNNNNKRPFAPTEALLPATRLKLWTDEAYEMTMIISKQQGDNESIQRIITDLDALLSSPPKLFPSSSSSSSMSQQIGSMAGQITPTISSANKDQYQSNRKGFNIGNKFAAMLNQADVERQWGMIQYAELQREQSNEMRKAFNTYTRQLNFDGDAYVLTASAEDRKRMIRDNDGLPTLTSVVASDLDLRDLYRNEYLTAIEDVTAEVSYQAKQFKTSTATSSSSSSSQQEVLDVTDVIDLMTQAHTAMTRWFELISIADVEQAVTLVQGE